MYFLQFLVFLQLFNYVLTRKDCSNVNESLLVELNEIIYFETPCFPFNEFITDKNNLLCNFSLINANDSENVRLLYYFQLYGGNYAIDVGDLSDNHEFYFDIQNNLKAFFSPFYTYEAFQGYFLFQNIADVECPMESITDIYEFKDENDILYIRSGFDKPYFRNNSCHWRFNSPPGYGFKVVIEILNISSTTQFRIENTTDLIVTERDAKIYYPYYNSDRSITITLTNEFQNYFTEMEFQAYITIVKETQQKTKVDCEISIKSDGNGFTLIWSYIATDTESYLTNMFCVLDVLIPPNFNMFPDFDLSNLEPKVDRVRYFDDYYDNYIDVQQDTMFTGFRNGSARIIHYMFDSDGSIPSKGFSVKFLLTPCICTEFIDVGGIVESTSRIMKYSDYICRNIECSIPIISFPPSGLIRVQIQLEIYTDDRPRIYDTIQILADNQIVFEINEYNTNVFFSTIFLNAEQKNVLNWITTADEYVYYTEIYLVILDVPEVDLKFVIEDLSIPLVLDVQFMFYLYDGAASVKLSDNFIAQNHTLTIYTNIFDISRQIQLYKNEQFSSAVSSYECFTPKTKYAYECATTDTKIIVGDFETELTGSELDDVPQNFLVFQSSKNYGGCLYENVYITKNLPYFLVAALSISDDPCIITILTDSDYYVERLWTTSIDKNVKISSGTDPKNVIHEFNSKTQNALKDIILTTKVYFVTIPKRTAFTMELSQTVFNGKILNVNEYPYQTIIPSSSYGTFNLDAVMDLMLECTPAYNITNVPTKFTILDINPSFSFYLYSFTTYERRQLKNIGDMIVVENDLIQFFCNWHTCRTLPCKAFLFMSTLNSDNVFEI